MKIVFKVSHPDEWIGTRGVNFSARSHHLVGAKRTRQLYSHRIEHHQRRLQIYPADPATILNVDPAMHTQIRNFTLPAGLLGQTNGGDKLLSINNAVGDR